DFNIQQPLLLATNIIFPTSLLVAHFNHLIVISCNKAILVVVQPHTQNRTDLTLDQLILLNILSSTNIDCEFSRSNIGSNLNSIREKINNGVWSKFSTILDLTYNTHNLFFLF